MAYLTVRQLITKDSRYIIQMEYTGHPSAKPRWVFRFLNSFISEHGTYDEALRAAIEYDLNRF